MALRSQNNHKGKYMTNITNVISSWGDEEQWFCITKNSLCKKHKKALVKKYNSDKSSININEIIFLEEDKDCYEMWVNGETIGLFALQKTFSWEMDDDEIDDHLSDIKLDDHVYLNLDSVFVVKEYRGKGLGSELATIVAQNMSSDIVNVLSERKPDNNKFDVKVFADYDSEEGENFTNIFSTVFAEGAAFFEIMKNNGVNVSLEMDVGY